MKKRILPALLALCMVMSLLPVSVFANEGDPCSNSEDCVSGCKLDGDGNCVHVAGCKDKCDGTESKACSNTGANDKHKNTCPSSCTGVAGDSCPYTGSASTHKSTCGKYEAAQEPVTPAKKTCSDCGCEIKADADPKTDCTETTCVHKTTGNSCKKYSVCKVANCKSKDTVVVTDTHKHVCTCGCDIAAEGGCGCTGDVCGCSNSKTACDNKDCLYQVCTDNDFCMKQGEVHKVGECVTGDANCNAKGNAAYNGSRKACTNKTHTSDCFRKCTVEECFLTNGHDGDHADAKGAALTTCTKDAKCKAESDHKIGCPVGDAEVKVDKKGTIDKDTETVKDRTVTVNFTKQMPIYVPCECGANHKDDGTHIEGDKKQCPLKAGKTKDDGVKVMFTVTTSIDVKIPEFEAVKTEDGKETDVTKTKAKLEEEAKKAKAAAEKLGPDNVVDAKGNKINWDSLLEAQNGDKADTKYTPDGKAICDACKAALGMTTCTKAIDCNATKHDTDCLTLCTHGTNCKNTKGSAAAHVVHYKVVSSVKDEKTGKVTTTVIGSYKTYEAAVAARTDKKWSIVTDPCPMAQVNESVVVGPDEEAPAEDPTVKPDEPKAPEKAEDFSDLKGDEWYAEDLTNLMAKGIVKGSLDDGKYSFGATDKLTTSHLVVFLSRVLDKGLVTEGKDWDKAATAWATEDGLTEGVEAGEITRKDVVLVLWRAAGKPESTQSLEGLTDVEGLTEDETAALRWAVETKVITGYEDNTFKPADSITRAEMMAVLSRFDKAVAK